MTVDLSTRDLACRLSHDAGLRLDQLALPGNDWVDAAASPLFGVLAGGAHIHAHDDGLQVLDVRIEDGLASTGCVTRLRHAPTGLEITHHFVVHAEGLIESRLDVRNAGDRSITLTRLDSLALALKPAACELMYYTAAWGDEFGGVRRPLREAFRLETRAGRSSNQHHPWFILFRAGASGMLSMSVAWSGNWCFRFDPHNGGWLVSGGLSDWEFATTLQPGETIAAPPVVLVLAEGDDLNAISIPYARVGRRRWYPRNAPARRLPVEWNHWWSYEDKAIDEATFRANIAVAAEMGIEVCTLDAGWFGPPDPATHWYDYRGDWHLVNTTRFPNGIRALADDAHSRGLKFGLWCEIEGLGRLARLAEDHPEFVAARDGERLGYVCLGDPAAQEWAFETLSRLVDDFALDWVKLDFNLDPGAGCNRADHGHAAGDGLYAHYQGYYRLLQRLRARYPEVIWENCSSGGLRVDLGMLRHTHFTFLSDPDWPEHSLQLFWGATTMLAPDALLRWTYSEWINGYPPQQFNPRDPNLQPHELDYFIRIGMLGVMGLSQKLPELPAWVRERYTAHIALYKSLVRRFVREADLYRLTEQPKRDGSGDRWAAFQYALPDADEHLLFVFRLPGGAPTRTLHLRALHSGRDYLLQWRSHARAERRTGAQLMREGLRFDDLRERDSALVHIQGNG
ncbi:MAG: alpha-galactosidase [Anaerolineae bacterium]|nr:alpha-galactosidase [Candidatus Roseilinea sp.]MDW8451223.1 alpha-galactosidase [Anaerolineae bacterium]